MKAYAQTHGLSVSALYTAHSTLKRRGVLSEPGAPVWVPVRIPPLGVVFRVHLPNGASFDPNAARTAEATRGCT